VFALELACRSRHRRFIEGPRHMQDTAKFERRHNSAAKDAIAILLRQRTPARVKIGANFLGGNNTDRGRQQRVERALKFARFQPGMRLEMRDLAQRMHAGVGAARAVNDDFLLRDFARDIVERGLHSRQSRLKLPAVEGRAVVSDSQLDGPHGAQRIIAREGADAAKQAWMPRGHRLRAAPRCFSSPLGAPILMFRATYGNSEHAHRGSFRHAGSHQTMTIGFRDSPAPVSGLLMVCICVLMVNGCVRKANPGEPDTVNFLIEQAPTNLDPRIGTDAISEHIDGLIFDSLVAHDQRLNVVPDLARKWETPNPLTYVFHLNKGVKFHDGRPLTSADVKYTFESILDRSVKTGKVGSFRIIHSIETPDDYTVVFHLREPYASFLWDLTRPGIGIVPRGSGADFGRHPIGTGPYRFVSATTDEEIVLERNPTYFGGAADIPRVRLRIVPDAIVRALELRKGTADVAINSLSPDTVIALQRDPHVIVDDQAGTTLQYIAINCEDPILSHREVRQALAYATDRNSLIQNLKRGFAVPADSVLPANHWAYDPNVTEYNYNPQKAEKLLDAAGYRRGPHGVRFHITLKTSTDQFTRLLAEALAAEWQKVGVALDLRSMEFATFYSDITHGSFQLYTLQLIGGNNDPDIFEYLFSSKKMPPDGANRGHYKNPELDALLDQARVEMDTQKRKEILSKIQKILSVDEPYITLWYADNVCVHRKRLTNIVLPPAGDFDFLDLARLLPTK
jgi:peptide/nickel transport system substrate-binding protein